jgi:hypothetical protein
VKALPCSGPLPFDPSSIARVWNKNFGAFCRKIRSFLWIVGQFSAGDDGMQQKFGALRFGIVVSLSLFFVLGSRSAALASSQPHDATATPISVHISHQKDSGAKVSRYVSKITFFNPPIHILNGGSTQNRKTILQIKDIASSQSGVYYEKQEHMNLSDQHNEPNNIHLLTGGK